MNDWSNPNREEQIWEPSTDKANAHERSSTRNVKSLPPAPPSKPRNPKTGQQKKHPSGKNTSTKGDGVLERFLRWNHGRIVSTTSKYRTSEEDERLRKLSYTEQQREIKKLTSRLQPESEKNLPFAEQDKRRAVRRDAILRETAQRNAIHVYATLRVKERAAQLEEPPTDREWTEWTKQELDYLNALPEAKKYAEFSRLDLQLLFPNEHAVFVKLPTEKKNEILDYYRLTATLDDLRKKANQSEFEKLNKENVAKGFQYLNVSYEANNDTTLTSHLGGKITIGFVPGTKFDVRVDPKGIRLTCEPALELRNVPFLRSKRERFFGINNIFFNFSTAKFEVEGGYDGSFYYHPVDAATRALIEWRLDSLASRILPGSVLAGNVDFAKLSASPQELTQQIRDNLKREFGIHEEKQERRSLPGGHKQQATKFPFDIANYRNFTASSAVRVPELLKILADRGQNYNLILPKGVIASLSVRTSGSLDNMKLEKLIIDFSPRLTALFTGRKEKANAVAMTQIVVSRGGVITPEFEVLADGVIDAGYTMARSIGTLADLRRQGGRQSDGTLIPMPRGTESVLEWTVQQRIKNDHPPVSWGGAPIKNAQGEVQRDGDGRVLYSQNFKTYAFGVLQKELTQPLRDFLREFDNDVFGIYGVSLYSIFDVENRGLQVPPRDEWPSLPEHPSSKKQDPTNKTPE